LFRFWGNAKNEKPSRLEAEASSFIHTTLFIDWQIITMAKNNLEMTEAG
jgi:hypothetical protein